MELTAPEILARTVRSGADIAILAGAGISRPAPTGMPTASDLVAQIVYRLDRDTPVGTVRLERYLKELLSTPFEAFMSRLYQGIDSAILPLLTCFSTGEPNHLHRFVAACGLTGTASVVVTTNFDNMIEKALGKALSHVDVYWTAEPDLHESARGGRPILFKAHGSLKDPHGNDVSPSILTTVEAISRQATAATTAALVSLFKHRTLIVLGYSGGDRFDVLPALRSADTSQVLWVDHSDCEPIVVRATTLRPHVAAVLGSNDIVVRGDATTVCRILASAIPAMEIDWRVGAGATPPPIDIQIPPGCSCLLAALLLLAFGSREQDLAAELLRLHLSDPTIETLYRARGLVALAQAIEFTGEPAHAAGLYQEAVDIYHALGDSRAKAKTLSDWGTCLVDLEAYEESQKCQERALEIGEQLGDAEVVNMACHGLGVVMEYLDRRSDADAYYDRAVDAARTAGTLVRLALGIGNRLINRSLMGFGPFVNERSLEQELELLQLYDGLGMDNTQRRGRHIGLAAFLFASLYGHRAEDVARGHPTLRAIGLSEQVASQAATTGFR